MARFSAIVRNLGAVAAVLTSTNNVAHGTWLPLWARWVCVGLVVVAVPFWIGGWRAQRRAGRAASSAPDR